MTLQGTCFQNTWTSCYSGWNWFKNMEQLHVHVNFSRSLLFGPRQWHCTVHASKIREYRVTRKSCIYIVCTGYIYFERLVELTSLKNRCSRRVSCGWRVRTWRNRNTMKRLIGQMRTDVWKPGKQAKAANEILQWWIYISEHTNHPSWVCTSLHVCRTTFWPILISVQLVLKNKTSISASPGSGSTP